METFDYRLFLREELVARCRRNPAYSARAMARDLKLSAPFFSQVLSGSRILSEDRALQISENFRWPRSKKTIFIKLVRYQSAHDSRIGDEVLKEIKQLMLKKKSAKSKFHKMRLDEFKIVSEWHHLAIYELASLKSFRDDPMWIASRLRISNEEAESSIKRLMRVGLFEEIDGKRQKSKGPCMMGATPSSAIRAFHLQHLEIASRAIETQDQKLRDFSGTTMAIDIKKLPRAKALIRQFNNEIMKLLESGEQTAVYHLAVQLYRLDED